MLERLQELAAQRRAEQDALAPTTPPRFDSVWEDAMEVEYRLDHEGPDLTGAVFGVPERAG